MTPTHVPAHKRANHVTSTDDRKVLAYGHIKHGQTTITTPDDPCRRILRLVSRYGRECRRSALASGEERQAADDRMDEAYARVVTALYDMEDGR